MSRKRHLLAGAVVALATAVLPAVATASITPTLALTQSTTAAGASANVGLDIKFATSGGDSPKDLTVKLPAGLLANAAIDGGACLRSTTQTSACQVGSGTVTATSLGLPLPISLPITFYLAPPPSPRTSPACWPSPTRAPRWPRSWDRRPT